MAKKAPAKSLRRLTPAQQLFADLIIAGGKPSECYSKAYPNSNLTGNALAVQANKGRALPNVQEYIEKALAERRSEVLLTRDKKRQLLGGIAQSKTAPYTARIQAIQVDNRMTGDDAPVRIEGEITLHAIFQALRPATSLPAVDEVEQMKLAEPDPVENLKTAMERAG